MPKTDDNPMVCVGMITSAHGVRGEVKIKSYLQDPEAIEDFEALVSENGKRSFQVHIRSGQGDMLIAQVDGVKDRNMAETLRNTKLYVPRSALPETEEDEFYHQDLIGIPVLLQDGSAYGTVHGAFNFGAGDILEISILPDNVLRMFSFTKETFPEVDLTTRRIVIDPPETLSAKGK